MAEPYPTHESGGEAPALGPVLVIDDDAQLQRIIQWLLEDEGLTVEVASNGEEGLARAEATRPSLVILDLNLPALDGEGVAEGVRATCGAGLPIIVVSSDGMVGERAREIDAAAWLNKPFEIEDLLAAVKRALAPRR